MSRYFLTNRRQLEMFLLDERIFGCFGKLSWKFRSAANPDMIFASPVCWPGDATFLPPLGGAAAELMPKFFNVIHRAA